MISDNSGNEFKSGQGITLQIKMTPEIYALFKEWDANIPTLYFLDICVVNVTKLSANALEKDARKGKLADYLRWLDRPQNSFSYLCALIEKVSDSRGKLSDSELEKQILNDVTGLRAFFRNARVIEPDDFLISYLRELRGLPNELARPNYIKFLKIINSQFKLMDTVPPILRLEKFAEILKEADTLLIAKQHIIIFIVLGCLYGNKSAKKLMKFKKDSKKFEAENALADIMLISRFAQLRLQIEQMGRKGNSPYIRSKFITDDDGLTGMIECFDFKAVKFEVDSSNIRTKFDVSPNLEQLLTDLSVENESDAFKVEELEEAEATEYDKILNLLTDVSVITS